MKTIYLIFECDIERSIKSYVIKLITHNKDLAIKHYKTSKHIYEGDEEYYLNLAEYEPDLNGGGEVNVLRELIIMKTTDENYNF